MNESKDKSNNCLTVVPGTLLSKGDTVVCGISGGPDSMCMLHMLNSLKEEYQLKLYAVHLNHQFRGADADADAAYVKTKCEEWGIPSHIEVFDVPKYIKETGMSPEEAGREIRYKLFHRIYEEVGGTKIAVAQNQNDNVETILMRFMRGTGIEGLKGIEPVRDNIIRPLLNVDRASIEEYCEHFKIEPRIDKTNYEPIYARNKIRLELLPYIKSNFNPNFNAAVTRFSEIITRENDYLQKQAEESFKKVACICRDSIKYSIQYNIPKLIMEHDAIKRRVIRIGLETILGDLKGIEYKHIELIINLINEKTGAAVILPGALRAYISYDNLILRSDFSQKNNTFSYDLNYYNENIFEDTNTIVEIKRKSINEINGIIRDPSVIFIDEEKVKEKLVYRNRNEGDVFSPFGMKGSKKLKDYFIDEKIPREERAQLHLIADGKEVVWVIGRRMSDKYKITDTTKKVLVINIRRGIKDAE